jgi:hypothetical protein
MALPGQNEWARYFARTKLVVLRSSMTARSMTSSASSPICLVQHPSEWLAFTLPGRLRDARGVALTGR